MKEEHVFFKSTDEEDVTEVTTLAHDQIFNLGFKLSKENNKLDKNIKDL